MKIDVLLNRKVNKLTSNYKFRNETLICMDAKEMNCSFLDVR